MVVSRRSLLLAGAAIPTAAYGQCVTDRFVVDACRGGVRGSSGPPGQTLDLNFMFPGSLDPRITFTRASSATYTDASGVIQTAATNAPRWDYANGVLRGLLIEETRTNVVLNSGDASNASWGKSGNVVAAPVVTGNQVTSPDGTLTAARVVYPASAGGISISALNMTLTFVGTVAPYTMSVWARGNVGGEQTYLMFTDGTTFYRTRITLTTAWQRFTLTTPNLTAANWFPGIGIDLRDGSQTSTPAQTIYAWGALVEQGAFPTSYIPTTSVSVTRAADLPSLPVGSWYASPGGSWMAEFVRFNTAAAYYHIVDSGFAADRWPVGVSDSGNPMQYDGNLQGGAGTSAANTIAKMSTTWAPGTSKVCVNGGVVNTAASLVSGYAAAGPFVLFQVSNPVSSLSGYIRRVTYWNRALSDAEMQQVTT